MIRLFGELALMLALIAALLQSLLPVWGYARNNPYLLAVARPAALGQFFFIASAYALLTIAFASNDFSIAYVAENSHPSLPLMYRLTAVWGAHEGSILLWILILNLWTIVFSFFKNDSLTLAVLGMISVGFLTFLLLTSNPFLAATTITNGFDLNPLLQDPGFVIHPPMLYMGYVGFSVAFAITQAALICDKLDREWAHTTRQFAIAAWSFLTFGITLGSWWAYRVLGWGGFWFWDPVENASLLPWLSGVALIHILVLVEKREIAKGWAALLANICFALSLLGTFLVRSGVLISAHTFANDPKRGVFLLLLLGLLSLLTISLYFFRISSFKNVTPTVALSWLTRETSLLLNSSFLFIAMLIVLLGTLYPLILDALHLGTVSVGAPYFNKVMLPLVFIVMIFMGLAPFLQWGKQSTQQLFHHAWKKILFSIVFAGIFLWSFAGYINVIALISLSLSLWIITSIRFSLRNISGMSIAHCGFAILIIGVLLSSVLSQERQVRMQPGDISKIGPYQFFFVDSDGSSGSNYRGIQTTFEVLKNNRHVANLYPEKRIYLVRGMVMTKVDINPTLFRDLYIALGEPLEGNYWSVRLYYKPFIRWIWFGGLIMMIGGFFAIRERIGEKL